MVKFTFNLENFSMNKQSLNYKAKPLEVIFNNENDDYDNMSTDMIIHSPVKTFRPKITQKKLNIFEDLLFPVKKPLINLIKI